MKRFAKRLKQITDELLKNNGSLIQEGLAQIEDGSVSLTRSIGTQQEMDERLAETDAALAINDVRKYFRMLQSRFLDFIVFLPQ